MFTPVTPQEAFLLERYVSSQYFDQMLRAWETMINYVESALDNFMASLPAGYRKRPLPEQPDVVWGQQVLPNFRNTLALLRDRRIQLENGDLSALFAAQGVLNDYRGQREYSSDWLDEISADGYERYIDMISASSLFASNIMSTAQAIWCKQQLGVDYAPERGPLQPPELWPDYKIDQSVTVDTGEVVTSPGVYVPHAQDASLQFLIPGRSAPQANVGLSKSGGQYDHREASRWTLLRRSDDVTHENGLVNLLAAKAIPLGSMAAGTACPRDGWWFTPARSNSRHHFRAGSIFPTIEGSAYGDTYWQWSPDQSAPSL